jgi:hypothetical protein
MKIRIKSKSLSEKFENSWQNYFNFITPDTLIISLF